MRRSNPLDLFNGSVADIRGFIPLSDPQNKGNVRLSGGFRAPEANLGSHGWRHRDRRSLSSWRGQPDWNWARLSCEGHDLCSQQGGGEGGRSEPGARSVSLSSGTVVEPPRGQLYQHAPALRRQLRSSSKQQTRNNRRRRRAALAGSERAGRHASGTRASPGAFWNGTERTRLIKECEQQG